MLLAETGFVLGRCPARVLAPDLAFVSRVRLPVLPRGIVEGAPQFAVEVRSPRDSAHAVDRKAGIWIAHGVEVVSTVHPAERTIVVHRPSEPPVRARDDEVVDAAPALPEFRLRAGDAFRDLA